MAAALIAMEIDAFLEADAVKRTKENLENDEKRKSQFEIVRTETEKLIDAKIVDAKTSPEAVKKIVFDEIVKAKPFSQAVIQNTVRLHVARELKQLKAGLKKTVTKSRRRKSARR